MPVRRRRRVAAGAGMRWLRREGAWVCDVRDSVAEGAADGGGAGRELERGAAVGAIY